MSKEIPMANRDEARKRVRGLLVDASREEAGEPVAQAREHSAVMRGVSLKQAVFQDFNLFLRDRAQLVERAMAMLVNGDSPSLDRLWSEHVSQQVVS